jgi:hypothetical protein
VRRARSPATRVTLCAVPYDSLIAENVDTDKHLQAAIAIGEANKRTMELVQNWCAHLAINKHGGGGLVEQFSSLPIGPRSLSCPHAAAPGFAGSDLKFVAIDFHDRNCVGCAHRKPVGFPNLSSLIRERDAAREATAAEEARRDAAAAAALQARDAKRRTIRADLAPPGANVIDQIEELDHDRDDANADRLVETVKLAPEVFTPLGVSAISASERCVGRNSYEARP